MNISIEQYRDKLRGALLGRFAGCVLGCPVEGWTIDRIEEYANECGIGFPPTDYWPKVPNPDQERYIYNTFKDYTRPCFDGIPGDDDIGYTLLSLLIAEEGNGKDFTLQDVADAWLKYITLAWTAEDVAIKNLKNGLLALVPAIIFRYVDHTSSSIFTATGLLISVSCALEFNTALESQIMMKTYKGFLK